MTPQRSVGYWGSTAFATLVLGATGVADLLRLPAIMESLAHLGYPTYFATILGTWEVLGGAAIVAPRLPLLKEWAYAGMFFTLTGAGLSHAAAGDPAFKVLLPFAVLAAVVTSWALRPVERRLLAADVPSLIRAELRGFGAARCRGAVGVRAPR